MHNTINFWYGNWEKVCMKRSWQREDAKKGGPALHTNKNFISSWFLICKLGYSRKKMGVKHIRFWKKQLEFLGLLFHPWKFWKRQSYTLLLRIFPHGFNGSVFYYITILFSHQLSGPDFVCRKKHGFLSLVTSRLKIFISHQKLQGAQVIRLKRNFANWKS